MKTCHACKRESIGLCHRCGKNRVCEIHDGADIATRTSVVTWHPVCLACRFGWPK